MPLPAGFIPDAPEPAAGGLPPGFVPDAPEATERTFSAPETFGLNAANLFGAGPAVYGALKYIQSGAQEGSYTKARDELQGEIDATDQSDEHPWARRAGKLAAMVGETVVGGGVGKAVGLAAKGAGAVAKLAPWAVENPVIAKALQGAASGAAYGAASGAGTAASKGEDVVEGARGGVAGGALLGGALGGVAGAAGKLLRGAPEAEAENLLRGVTQGDGLHGGSTLKAKKLVDRQSEAIVDTLRSDPELRAVAVKPAKEALPVFQQRLEQVGSKLDPHYDVVDKVTGGVSVHNLVNTLDDEIARLAKDPLNEQYIAAVNDIKQSVLKAWAPDLEKISHSQGKLAQMGIETPLRLQPEDVMVPTREVRKMVTRLQTRGSQVINPLNPGEASKMKADMATMLKGFIDSHLDVAAEQSPQAAAAVSSIYDINRTYSALKTMTKAIEDRAWKESTGSTSGTGYLKQLFGHGGIAAAAPLAMAGHLPAAAAALVSGALVPKIPAAARAANSMLANLQRAAQAGNPRALRVLASLRTAQQIGTAGAGQAGAVVGSVVNQQLGAGAPQ